MPTFVLGDIHGAAKALDEVLIESNFDFDKDTLITLGDYSDGWPDSYDVVETLLCVKNLIPILGNHDVWIRDWLKSGQVLAPGIWINQGGLATIDSYKYHPYSHHTDFYSSLLPFHHDTERNYLFLHGGWDYQTHPDITDVHPREYEPTLTWDRSLWEDARFWTSTLPTPYDKIFIGHTAHNRPTLNRGNVFNLDTGAGWSGHLTLLNLDTMKPTRSTTVQRLYKNSTGRF